MRLFLNLLFVVFSVCEFAPAKSLSVESSIRSLRQKHVAFNASCDVQTDLKSSSNYFENETCLSLLTKKRFHPILLTIEGNIGAGKTYLFDSLRRNNPNWIFIDEPIADWLKLVDEFGESILSLFFNDMKRWSFTFQICALMTRHQKIETAVEKARNQRSATQQVFVTERSLESGHHVFTKLLQKQGNINQLEVELYRMLLNNIRSSGTATPLSAIVHVNTPPSVCAERIKLRNRPGEEDVPMDYLIDLHNAQDEWIQSETGVDKLVIADSANVETVEKFVNELLLKLA